jgi:16S rRNA (cytosine1402-N4)-methyltransferase
VQANFCELAATLRSLQIEKVDAVLADLGWRIEQFETGGKGLSFRADEPLIMTFGDPIEYPFTARDIVNEWEEETLSNIFFGYAEERYAKRIAKQIVARRAVAPIETTHELVAIVKSAVPSSYLHKRTHPATKVFQALRIAVNDELGALEKFLTAALQELEVGGRLAIITFHSIEDRIVKQTFRSFKQAGQADLINKKPIVPSRAEMETNSRARSAKLRIIEKIINV